MTKIPWTEQTWNPIIGCTMKSKKQTKKVFYAPEPTGAAHRRSGGS